MAFRAYDAAVSLAAAVPITDRLHLFRIAAGSLAELRAQLALAVAWGYANAGEAPVIADQLAAMLWKLTHPKGAGGPAANP